MNNNEARRSNDKELLDATHKPVGNAKKNREEFRTSLVDIIM